MTDDSLTPGQKIDKAIMDKMWNLLWDSASPMYLPDVILNGFSGKGITVDKLAGRLTIDKLGPFPIWTAAIGALKLGHAQITFSSVDLDGLKSISQTSWTPSASDLSFSAKVSFSSDITANSSYTVETSGLDTCALLEGGGLLNYGNNPPPYHGVAAAAGTGHADTDPNETQGMEQARTYRDQLLQSDNGYQLVNSFYTHNPVLTEVFNTQTDNPAFIQYQHIWINYYTQSGDTNCYTWDCAVATKEATAPGSTTNVNQTPGFNYQAITMNVQLVNALRWTQKNRLQIGSPTYKAYDDAINDTISFATHVAATGNSLLNTQVMTAGQVMDTIKNAPSGNLLAKNETSMTADEYLKEHEDLIKKADTWYNSLPEEIRSKPPVGKPRSDAQVRGLGDVGGTATITFKGVSVSLSGSITLPSKATDPPTITLSSVTGDINDLSIFAKPTSYGDGPSAFAAAVMNAKWVASKFKAQAVTEFSGDDVSDFLSKSLSASIANFFTNNIT